MGVTPSDALYVYKVRSPSTSPAVWVTVLYTSIQTKPEEMLVDKIPEFFRTLYR